DRRLDDQGGHVVEPRGRQHARRHRPREPDPDHDVVHRRHRRGRRRVLRAPPARAPEPLMPAEATRTAWRAAAAELAAADPVMAQLLDRHGPPVPRRGAPPARRFEALASSIAYQQLAGRAAATIWARVKDAVGEPFTPDAVLATGPEP